MQKALRSTFLILLAIAAFAAAGAAQTRPIDGEWDGSLTTPGGVSRFKVVFKADGEKLTGTVKRPAGDSALTGTIKGDDITFTYSIIYNENELVMTVTAKRSGDKIDGTVSFGGRGEGGWSASRQPPPNN